jgi:heme exporter protein C
MLWPLLIVALGFKLYFLTVVLLRIKSELIAARLRALDLAMVKGS